MLDDAVKTGLHYIWHLLDASGTYARLLLVDFSLRFNVIIPEILHWKLTQLNWRYQLELNPVKTVEMRVDLKRSPPTKPTLKHPQKHSVYNEHLLVRGIHSSLGPELDLPHRHSLEES